MTPGLTALVYECFAPSELEQKQCGRRSGLTFTISANPRDNALHLAPALR